ncbi:hypothetical protein EU524_01575 [Candidatus Thorarchaeota archaeon]|nr:MAG: hypothetical protein EU524_01575 [Candidatus Thorarchaeota archaeon]
MSTEEMSNLVRALAADLIGEAGFQFGKPMKRYGLSLVPIVTRREQDSPDYLNAAEALERGTLVLQETGSAVNIVLGRNTGQEVVLIEEGEILAGDGTQNRIVVANTLIEPGKEARIPVKCIHAPHPLSKGASFLTAGAGAIDFLSRIRVQKYQSIMTDVEHYIPEEAVSQEEVWRNIRRYSENLGVEDETDYTAALERIRSKAREMAEELRVCLPEDTCGLVAVNSVGEVVSVELYNKPGPFGNRRGFIEALLVEHATDEREDTGVEVTELVREFLQKLENAESDEIQAKEGHPNLVMSVAGLHGEAVVSPAAPGGKAHILYCSLGKAQRVSQ